MRIKYYRRTLRQMRTEKSFVLFFLFLIIFSSLTTFYVQIIEPVLIQFTESNAYMLALKTSEEAIRGNIDSITYESIVTGITDNEGRIVALQANIKELNKISNEVALSIEEGIRNVGSSELKIPLGLFFNAGIFSGAGVRIRIKTVPLGDTKIECVSELDSVGINQVRHRIILKVKTAFTIIAPVYVKNQIYEKEIILAETIINGDIPETYYNLNLEEKSDLMQII